MRNKVGLPRNGNRPRFGEIEGCQIKEENSKIHENPSGRNPTLLRLISAPQKIIGRIHGKRGAVNPTLLRLILAPRGAGGKSHRKIFLDKKTWVLPYCASFWRNYFMRGFF